jgi:flagellar L-ring protein precursor FlgH
MSGKPLLAGLVSALVVLATVALGAGQQAKGKAQPPPPPKDAYEALFAEYLQEARRAVVASPSDEWAWMNGLALDRRARRVNDLLTIRVVENITASGTADSSLSKTSSSSHSLLGLFGLENKLPSFIDPTKLAGGKNDSQFKGGGTTTRAGELTAIVTARVAEVLPNGDLVVEGAREIEINGDRQIIVLSGVARVSDVDPQNAILSTSIGQLRIRYFGRGLMKDNLSPGFLIRVLNKIF